MRRLIGGGAKTSKYGTIILGTQGQLVGTTGYFRAPENIFLTGLLILRDGAILHNRPQIASDRTIHEKSHNSQKNAQHS